MGKLSGKTAIITGGARGMGAATARVFVAEGANVVITDILEDEGSATAESVGETDVFIKHDVSKEADWENVIKTTLDSFGAIHILINNAGIVATCLLYTSPSPRDRTRSRMPSSA